MDIDLLQWANLLLVPLSSIIAWFAGSRHRYNTAIQELQQTVDLLVKKNVELYEQNLLVTEQLTAVRKENAELKAGQERMSKQLNNLQKENSGLKKQIQTLTHK